MSLLTGGNTSAGSTLLGGGASASTVLKAPVNQYPIQQNMADAVLNATNFSLDGNAGGVNTNPQPTPTYVDPYAQWGGQDAYNRLVSGFDTQKNNIYSTATDAANNYGLGYKNSVLDFIDSLKTGQMSIDNKAVNNVLAKQRGTADILGMVNRGISSGGVLLANKNASDSSAAGAIARAYGNIGQRQQSNVNNQFELGNRDISQAQANFDMQEQSGVRNLTTSKEQAINTIVADARNQLASLDAQMANASLPGRIAIENEKEAIRQKVIGQLSQYDAALSSGTAAIHPMDQNARIAEATRLASLGQAPSTQFNYTTDTPVQFQNTGPFASELPIFTYNRNRKSA